MKYEIIQNDLPDDVRLAAIALLKQQLANALDLGMQAKQAHWNVKGPHFLPLHELFDQVAETVEQLSDLLAERAAQIGAIVEGTAQDVVRDSRLPVYPPGPIQESDHVRALATSLAQFAASVRKASKHAEIAGDADTADILTQASRAADLLLWKVASHVSEPEAQPTEKLPAKAQQPS